VPCRSPASDADTSGSPREALKWHGKSDNESFRPPIARTFSSKLAGHRCANKKVAKSIIAHRVGNRRSAEFCPGNDDGSSDIGAMNLDLPITR
jgi:hypothetical protein